MNSIIKRYSFLYEVLIIKRYICSCFLAEAKSKDGKINVGKSAIVIGGGDVGMEFYANKKRQQRV